MRQRSPPKERYFGDVACISSGLSLWAPWQTWIAVLIRRSGVFARNLFFGETDRTAQSRDDPAQSSLMNSQIEAALIAGIVSLISLGGTVVVAIVGFRTSARITRDTLVEQRRQLEATLGEQHNRTLNERFATAAEKLGSDKPAAVRLAGVHAMAGLADDWAQNRQTCIDVLCAYLRLPSQSNAGERSTEAALEIQADQEVRNTIVRIIADHLRETGSHSWQICNFDFAGIALERADFTGVHLAGKVSFANAELGWIDFRGAQFSGTVSFLGVRLVGGRVNFRDAEFSAGTVNFFEAKCDPGVVSFMGARFTGANVEFLWMEFGGRGADFSYATFSGGEVQFDTSNFASGANFYSAHFSGAAVRFGSMELCRGTIDFTHAEFSAGSINFLGTKLCGVELTFDYARFGGSTVDFRRAKFAAGTVSFRNATLSAGELKFGDAKFAGGTVDFTQATLSGGTVGFDDEHFGGAQLTSGSVYFDDAQFQGSRFIFGRTRFAGTAVRFARAQFSSGIIDFRIASEWSDPPTFDWPADTVSPDWIMLPGGTTPSTET